MNEVWESLTAAQAGPPPWAVLLSAAVALATVAWSGSWHLSRGLITIAHEGGHALAALLTRRKLQGIRLHSDTSGVTLTRGRPRGPGMILTAAAGYVTPSLLGVGGAWLTATGHVAILIAVVIGLLAAMLLLIRNLFGAVSLLATGGAIFAVTWYSPPGVDAVLACLAVWFLLFGGVRPILELRRKRSRGHAPDSDADQLARLTFLPGGFWVLLFLLVACACLAGGAWLLNPLPWPA
ncbi:M50 family metallopeptidase [Streptosporangium pseudovulgare]|uniref:Membrane protein n=1 Tax=Streptosporangium pseudovulgare TaxID=35765 RepID=A0ABQ2QJV7_9ACTN|nr:M50 family metallopeptidase [Streptosporangium pseudovulgare]GGP82220.1 membrane protein [Streptosporangium pseudovulgare]